MNLHKGWVMDNACIRQKVREYQNHKHRLARVRSVLDTGRQTHLSLAGASPVPARRNEMIMKTRGTAAQTPQTASTFMTSVACPATTKENFHRRELKKTDNILKDNVVL